MLTKRAKRAWVVTSYFNPQGFSSKARNLEAFLKSMSKQGVPVLVAEMLAPGRGSEVKGDLCEVITFAPADQMWHKERLINLGVQALPSSAEVVVWSDCDLIFENNDWMEQTVYLLQSNRIVQPFTTAIRLPARGISDLENGVSYRSFCSVVGDGSVPELFANHGHTGFAWAASKRLLLDVGLYDRSIVGSSDHLMAHAFASDLDCPCLSRTFGSASSYRDHFIDWAQAAGAIVEKKLAAASGRVFHLWHGSYENRRYVQREAELIEIGYDPERDLSVRPDGIFNLENHDLKRWMNHFFSERREDE